MRSLQQIVGQALQAHRVRDCRVCVALSGGVDSVALLDVLCALSSVHRLDLFAVHVNHGLSPHAAQWESFCSRLCASLRIPLVVERVQVDRADGLGLEAAARRARYAAFARQRSDFVATAHHLDDQAETFLLQLLRGAGARGLSAMPVVGARRGAAPALLRPLLGATRDEIEAHACSRGLAWMEDESNSDTALDRNFLRHEILPQLANRFPGYRRTLARAAHNLADASTLLEALAQVDLRGMEAARGLPVELLRELPPVRALNLLRHLFAVQGLALPRRAALEEGLRQCLAARRDAQVRVVCGAHSLRRYRDRVFLVAERALPAGWSRPWQGEERIELPAELGSLHFIAAEGQGLSRRLVASAPLSVRFRRGGERMALARNRPHRDLRQLFQEAGVPAWEREFTPLVLCGDALAWVPGVGAAAEFRAEDGEPALLPSWDRAGRAQKAAC